MAVSKESRDKAPVTPEGRPRDRSQSEESRDGPGREERARKDDDPERRHRDNDDDRRRADDDDKPEGREASEDARAAKDKYGSNVCETCKKEVRGGKAGMRLHKETSKFHWQCVYWQRGMPWEQAKARAAREWEKAMSPSTVPNRPRRRRDDDDDGDKGDHKSAPKLRSRSRSRGAEKGKSRRRSRDTEKGKSRTRRGRSRSPRLRKGITEDEENLVLRHAALIQKERAYREKKREEKKAASAAKAPAKAPAQKKKDDDETSGSYEYVTETDDDLEAGKAKQAQQAASDKKKERLNAAKPKVAPGPVKPASTAAGSSSDGKKKASALASLWEAQAAGLRQMFDF